MDEIDLPVPFELFFNRFPDYLFAEFDGFIRDAAIARFFCKTIAKNEYVDLAKPLIENYIENIETAFLKKRVLSKLSEVEKLPRKKD